MQTVCDQLPASPTVATVAPFAPRPLEPEWPHPRRHWWLKRLVAGAVLLTLILGLVRVGWGWEARRRLLAVGAPLPDLSAYLDPVPDADNGALVYRRAMAQIGTESPSSSTLSYNQHLPFPPRWHKLADESLRTNGGMLAGLREARRYDRFDWGVKPGPAGAAPAPGYLLRGHHTANLVGDAALHAHVHGDDVEAVERIRDRRHLAAALGAPPTSLNAHMLRVYSIEGGALFNMQIIAAGLTIAPEETDDGADAGNAPSIPSTAPVRPAPRPAMRSQVRALIAELLDERDQAAGLRRTYVGERRVQLDTAAQYARAIPLLRPMLEIDAARVARAHAAFVAAAAATDAPEAKTVLAAEPLLWQTAQTTLWSRAAANAPVRPAGREPVDFTRMLSTDVCNTPRVSRAFDYDFRARADRRLTTAALAVRLYQADHAGRLPPSLDDLVPRYLPHVPADPFSAARRPIGYAVIPAALPDGRDRPLVYSVGLDGSDDTAMRGVATVPKLPCTSYTRGPDQWVDLFRWAPEPSDAERQQEAEAEKAVRSYDERGVRQ